MVGAAGEGEVILSPREAKALRNAKNRLLRHIDAQLRKQLKEIITENKDKLIDLVMMGGLVRVGIETAVPDNKVVNLDAEAIHEVPPDGASVTLDLADEQPVPAPAPDLCPNCGGEGSKFWPISGREVCDDCGGSGLRASAPPEIEVVSR